MINFPATTGQPTDGSFTHSEVGLTWTWNGTTWDVEGGGGPAGPQGPAGPTVVSADAGNISVIGTDGFIFTPGSSGDDGFPSGTRILFHMDTPPPGWVTDATLDNRALRVVSAGGTSGGSIPFTNIFSAGFATGGHSLSEGQLPPHGHGIADPGHAHGIGDPGHAHTYRNRINNNKSGGSNDDNTGWGDSGTNASGTGIWTGGAGTGIWTYAAGSGEAHSHGINLDIAYVNAIVAVKS
jgi:hypothetical protein